MQIQVENFALLANVLNQAKNIYIVVGRNADEDPLAAGLFLEENLSSLGKKVLLVFSGKVPEVLQNFAPKITSRIPAKKLVVSFNWRENEVEKVGYNLEGENFNFVINPRDKKINPENVRVFNSGTDPDLILTLAVKNLAEISGFDPQTLETKTIVNIDRTSANTNFGSLNFVHPSADSTSAIVASLLEKADLSTMTKSAHLLMLGIKSATNNFESVADSATFEAAAFCTKLTSKTSQNSKMNATGKDKNFDEKIFKTKQMTS